MAGKEEVGDALLHSVLMTAVAADQLTLSHRSLEKEMVQILECLLISRQLLRGRGLLRQRGEAQLSIR